LKAKGKNISQSTIKRIYIPALIFELNKEIKPDHGLAKRGAPNELRKTNRGIVHGGRGAKEGEGPDVGSLQSEEMRGDRAEYALPRLGKESRGNA